MGLGLHIYIVGLELHFYIYAVNNFMEVSERVFQDKWEPIALLFWPCCKVNEIVLGSETSEAAF